MVCNGCRKNFKFKNETDMECKILRDYKHKTFNKHLDFLEFETFQQLINS